MAITNSRTGLKSKFRGLSLVCLSYSGKNEGIYQIVPPKALLAAMMGSS
jgi:hypothetical protein